MIDKEWTSTGLKASRLKPDMDFFEPGKPNASTWDKDHTHVNYSSSLRWKSTLHFFKIKVPKSGRREVQNSGRFDWGQIKVVSFLYLIVKVPSHLLVLIHWFFFFVCLRSQLISIKTHFRLSPRASFHSSAGLHTCPKAPISGLRAFITPQIGIWPEPKRKSMVNCEKDNGGDQRPTTQ